MNQKYTTTIFESGPNNDLMIELPPAMVEALDWVMNDVLVWIDNSDGSLTIKRKIC